MQIRHSAGALAAALALTMVCACGPGEETPKATVGSQSEDPGPHQGDDATHPEKHEGDDNDEGRSPGKDDSQVIEVEVSGGAVDGVGSTVEVAVGQRVVLEVAADTDDEVHVHGYDVMATVSPSKPARIGFVADLPGAWEVELESAGMLLFELRVQ